MVHLCQTSLKFQFLIGTLKTKEFWTSEQRMEKFQFLIGTLKTKSQFYNEIGLYQFQFLIGTLKTVLLCFTCDPYQPSFNSS